MRSRCHSSVRSTCSTIGALPRHNAGRPSSPTTVRRLQRLRVAEVQCRVGQLAAPAMPRATGAGRAGAGAVARRTHQPGQPQLARQGLQPVVGGVEVAHRPPCARSGRQRHRLRLRRRGPTLRRAAARRSPPRGLQALDEAVAARRSVAACVAHQPRPARAAATRRPASAARVAWACAAAAPGGPARAAAPRPPGPAARPRGRAEALAREVLERVAGHAQHAAVRCCRPGCAPARSCRRRRRRRRSRCSARFRAASRRPRRRGRARALPAARPAPPVRRTTLQRLPPAPARQPAHRARATGPRRPARTRPSLSAAVRIRPMSWRQRRSDTAMPCCAARARSVAQALQHLVGQRDALARGAQCLQFGARQRLAPAQPMSSGRRSRAANAPSLTAATGTRSRKRS